MQLQSFTDDPIYKDHHPMQVELIHTYAKVGPNAEPRFRDDCKFIPIFFLYFLLKHILEIQVQFQAWKPPKVMNFVYYQKNWLSIQNVSLLHIPAVRKITVNNSNIIHLLYNDSNWYAMYTNFCYTYVINMTHCTANVVNFPGFFKALVVSSE